MLLIMDNVNMRTYNLGLFTREKKVLQGLNSLNLSVIGAVYCVYGSYSCLKNCIHNLLPG